MCGSLRQRNHQRFYLRRRLPIPGPLQIRGDSSPIATKLTYDRTDAKKQPEIEQYSINGTQAYVFDDPTTGQPGAAALIGESSWTRS